MSKNYVVKVSNTVAVPVKGSLKDDAGQAKKFSFTLFCKRLTAQEIKDRFDGGQIDFREFMSEVVTDWKAQQLVMEEDGATPAAFCPDALEALLNIGGMGMACYQAYLTEANATGKI
jgi:hypothetical protein